MTVQGRTGRTSKTPPPLRKVLQVLDPAQNINTFSVAHQQSINITSDQFLFSLFSCPALSRSCANTVVLSFQLIYSQSSPPISVFVYHRTAAPTCNYRPKVSLGTNYMSFHGRACETETRPPAGYWRRRGICVWFFFFPNCDIQIPGGVEQTFLIWVQWSSVML